MKYFIEKINEDNDYTIKSEVEVIFGGNDPRNNPTSGFVGYISNVKWDDEEIREKLSTMKVGEKYEVFK